MVAIGLVLSVHGLLVLLLVTGSRVRPRTLSESIAFVGLWVDPPAPVAPSAPLPQRDVRPVSPRSLPAPPVPGPVVDEPPNESSSTAISVAPTIDWQGEAKGAGRRNAEGSEGPDTFSAPPKTVRKPCEPPESSFVWNPELPRAGFTKTPIPLPFVRLGERCVVGLGFFACNLSPLPEANSHLFDDLKEGKTQESSVPDPNICD
ncbi:MAG: hypothetical protein RL030_2724 [Pseudomonadota bacterium]|jgi:hypothetical protein